MSFLPIKTSLIAALHDASVEHFVFDAVRGRLLLTLLLDSDEGPSHRQQQVVFSGIRNGAEVQQLQRLIDATLAAGKRLKLGYRLDEFCPLRQEASDYHEGRLSVRLVINHLPVLQLRCQKITSQEVNLM